MRSFLNVHDSLGMMRAVAERGSSERSTCVSDLMIIAKIQRKFDSGPLPNILRKAAPFLKEELGVWRSKTLRKHKYERLEALAERGDVWSVLVFVQDPADLEKDKTQAKMAEKELETIRLYLGDEKSRLANIKLKSAYSGEFVCLMLGILLALSSVWFEFCQSAL
ncbi:hypothetical protein AA106555_1402 [Neokomagataea thailandica NBRC 106555]|nr:hypothetical protein AA106555_1402 [Neokomagataea thailandica NBRC 106555]